MYQELPRPQPSASGNGGKGFSTDWDDEGVPSGDREASFVGGSANGLETDSGRRRTSDEMPVSASGLVTDTAGIVTCCASELAGESNDFRAFAPASSESTPKGVLRGPGDMLAAERSSSESVVRLSFFGSRNLSATFLALATEWLWTAFLASWMPLSRASTLFHRRQPSKSIRA